MKPDFTSHDCEIEKRAVAGRTERRVSCSCGFQGPWRKGRTSAYRDRDAHEDRRLAGEA